MIRSVRHRTVATVVLGANSGRSTHGMRFWTWTRMPLDLKKATELSFMINHFRYERAQRLRRTYNLWTKVILFRSHGYCFIRYLHNRRGSYHCRCSRLLENCKGAAKTFSLFLQRGNALRLINGRSSYPNGFFTYAFGEDLGLGGCNSSWRCCGLCAWRTRNTQRQRRNCQWV
jgi:hypothetical protein